MDFGRRNGKIMLKKLYFVLGVAGLLMVCGICIFAAAEIKNHDKEYFALFGRAPHFQPPARGLSGTFLTVITRHRAQNGVLHYGGEP